MEKILLDLPRNSFLGIKKHLLPEGNDNEQAVFAFAKTKNTNGICSFKIIDWEPIAPRDFFYHTEFYLELSDEKRGQIIKKAHDLKASLVEWHSHPGIFPAAFSSSDLSGLKEFVPHVMWRLNRRPYAAIVVTPRDFDGLAWYNEADPYQIHAIKIGSQLLKPTGETLIRIEKFL